MNNNKAVKKIIKELQGDLPLVSRPYLELAKRIDLTEQEVITIIGELLEEGLLRRLGAVLRHQKAGYDANAMVAWKVPKEESDRVGNLLAANPRVSHCYWRETPVEWPFNLFTMIHARRQEELQKLIQELSQKIGIEEYKVIKSVRELKKTSVQYL